MKENEPRDEHGRWTALIPAVHANLSDELRSKKYQGDCNPLTGHCYVASEALYHMLGGKEAGYKPYFVQHEGEPHWFLKHEPTGQIIDATAGQFRTPVPYEKAKGKGFLTRLPSKRAKTLMDRMVQVPSVTGAGHSVTDEARDTHGRWTLSPGSKPANIFGDTGATSTVLFNAIPAAQRKRLEMVGLRTIHQLYRPGLGAADAADRDRREKAALAARGVLKAQIVNQRSQELISQAYKDPALIAWAQGVSLKETTQMRAAGWDTMLREAIDGLGYQDTVSERMVLDALRNDNGGRPFKQFDEYMDQLTDDEKADLARAKELYPQRKLETVMRYMVNTQLSAWAHSATAPRSRAMQLAVAKRFGLDDEAVQERFEQQKGVTWNDTVKEYQANKPFYDAFVETVYDATQKQLADAGMSELHVARGMAWYGTSADERALVPEAVRDAVGTQIAVKLASNPASSWSTEGSVADEFASDGDTNVRMGMVVPAQDIFSLATTGPGALHEGEVLVIGNPAHTAQMAVTDKYADWGED